MIRSPATPRGFGWIFRAIREVAEAVVLYTDPFPSGNAVQVPVVGTPTWVAVPAMEPYAVRILEG